MDAAWLADPGTGALCLVALFVNLASLLLQGSSTAMPLPWPTTCVNRVSLLIGFTFLTKLKVIKNHVFRWPLVYFGCLLPSLDLFPVWFWEDMHNLSSYYASIFGIPQKTLNFKNLKIHVLVSEGMPLGLRKDRIISCFREGKGIPFIHVFTIYYIF